MQCETPRPVAKPGRHAHHEHLVRHGEPDQDHGGCERNAQQTPGAMTGNASLHHERRLQEEEHGPRREEEPMQCSNGEPTNVPAGSCSS